MHRSHVLYVPVALFRLHLLQPLLNHIGVVTFCVYVRTAWCIHQIADISYDVIRNDHRTATMQRRLLTGSGGAQLLSVLLQLSFELRHLRHKFLHTAPYGIWMECRMNTLAIMRLKDTTHTNTNTAHTRTHVVPCVFQVRPIRWRQCIVLTCH